MGPFLLAAATIIGASPSMAAGKPLGSVILADGGRLDNADATVGSTVFTGDDMATNQGGKIRLRLGAAQIYLLANTEVALGNSPEVPTAILKSGTVGFATSGQQLAEIDVAQATIRPKGPAPSNGEVRLISSKELLVSSFHGALEVNVDGDIRVVNEGSALRVLLDPNAEADALPDPQSGHVPVMRRRRVQFYLIPVGIAGVASYFVYQETAESCSTPDTH